MSDDMLVKDRDAAILWARKTLNAGDRVRILDTETTGLDNNAEMVQISIVDLNGNTVFETLVQPTSPIPAGATKIHGITNEMVKSAPRYDLVHKQVMEVLSGKRVVIYNVDYDRRIIYQSGKAFGYLPVVPADGWECAMQIYAEYCGEWDDYHGSYRWQKLPAGDHSATGDCIATLEIIKRMANANLSTETEDDPTGA